MRLVVQRVTRAVVRSGDGALGEIGPGAVVLAAIAREDTEQLVEAMADRLVALRYFDDADHRTNLSIADVGGQLLVVSQFTLLADTRRGRRPGFGASAPPEVAAPLVDRFVARLRAAGAPVATGRFGAAMEVELVNEGPFTLVLDSASEAAG